MIRLEEDLKTVNKKIKFSDLEKEYIINISIFAMVYIMSSTYLYAAGV